VEGQSELMKASEKPSCTVRTPRSAKDSTRSLFPRGKTAISRFYHASVSVGKRHEQRGWGSNPGRSATVDPKYQVDLHGTGRRCTESHVNRSMEAGLARYPRRPGIPTQKTWDSRSNVLVGAPPPRCTSLIRRAAAAAVAALQENYPVYAVFFCSECRVDSAFLQRLAYSERLTRHIGQP